MSIWAVIILLSLITLGAIFFRKFPLLAAIDVDVVVMDVVDIRLLFDGDECCNVAGCRVDGKSTSRECRPYCW